MAELGMTGARLERELCDLWPLQPRLPWLETSGKASTCHIGPLPSLCLPNVWMQLQNLKLWSPRSPQTVKEFPGGE